MRFSRGFAVLLWVFGLVLTGSVSLAQGQDYSGNEDPNKKILKQGLLGAGVGAISAEASGGKAGTGALVGAGTNVIGGALLDTLTAPPAQQAQPVYYQQQAPVYQQQAPSQGFTTSTQSYPVQTQGTVYRQDPVYVQQPVYYQQPPQENPNQKILKSGLMGAAVGGISASASGGKAGKGALIGAGTNIIGGALLDTLMAPSQPQQQQPVYYQQQAPVYQTSANQPKKKIIRKYDSDGNIISEEEVWE